MYIVNLPCQRCAVEHTMLRSDGRLLCMNCLLHRRPATEDGPAPLQSSCRRMFPPTSAA
jgi:hypothetical protein